MKRAGGKGKLAKHLLPLIAARPHTCYVEPFCGGCGLLLKKPRSQVEVINDTDHALVNCLRQLRHHLPEVLRGLEWLPNSRVEFRLRRHQSAETEIQRAVDYLYCNAISFGGENRSYGVTRSSGGGASARRESLLRDAQALADRLSGVSVECKDWQACAQLYDSPSTLFFFDPPYLGGAQKSYASWSEANLAAFIAALRCLRGDWIVTMNDSDHTRAAFAEWYQVRFTRANGIGANKTGKTGKRYGELIVCKRP